VVSVISQNPAKVAVIYVKRACPPGFLAFACKRKKSDNRYNGRSYSVMATAFGSLLVSWSIPRRRFLLGCSNRRFLSLIRFIKYHWL
jgi:hypothetical protein